MSPLHRCLIAVSLLVCLYAFPVIIDTDIGQDIDDSWALALSLKNPNMDIKMVLTAAHNPSGRAQIVAKYLTEVGRDDIPIGVGVHQDNYVGPLYNWAKNFSLSEYKGPMFTDGISEAIKILDASPEPVVILAIAPVPNMQAILTKRPDLASKMIVKAMSGSINICYGGKKAPPCEEYNVKEDVPASQLFYATKYKEPMVTAPIDIGYIAIIRGQMYQKILTSTDIITKKLIECYTSWAANGGHGSPKTQTTTIWDATAAYLVYSNMSFVELHDVQIVVDDKGETLLNTTGQHVHAAESWTSNGLQDWIANVVDLLTA